MNLGYKLSMKESKPVSKIPPWFQLQISARVPAMASLNDSLKSRRCNKPFLPQVAFLLAFVAATESQLGHIPLLPHRTKPSFFLSLTLHGKPPSVPVYCILRKVCSLEPHTTTRLESGQKAWIEDRWRHRSTRQLLLCPLRGISYFLLRCPEAPQKLQRKHDLRNSK